MSRRFEREARPRHPVGMALVFSAVMLAACKPRVLAFEPPDGGSGVDPAAQCTAGADWLPDTPPASLDMPAPHPASECPFFEGGFQRFLIATQPGATGEPALVSYATIDDVLTRVQPLPPGALAPPGTHRGTALRAWLGNVAANGLPSIALDQDGHTLYYGTHLNQAFVDFLGANGLQTARRVQQADPNLALPPGIVELKSAWKDIDPADGVSGDYSSYITTTAWVSHLSKSAAGELVEDKNHPRQIRVALVALHVSFTLSGHPELISATFEHAGTDGNADTAPSTGTNTPPDDPTNARVDQPVSVKDFLLYRAGTPANQANTAIPAANMRLDEATQSFAGQTSIYRMFPASRTNTTTIDGEITTLNQNVAALFASKSASLSPSDRRAHYRLVGALWLDKTSAFAVDRSLQNDAQSPFLVGPHINQEGKMEPPVDEQVFVADIVKYGTASVFSILGGHDRLASTAVESFTQAPGSFNHCVTCHNTKAIAATGIPFDSEPSSSVKLLNASLLNVSRVFFQLVREECYVPPNTVVDGSVFLCP